MSLVADTLDTVRGLTALLAEETAALAARAKDADLKAFAASKALLADRISEQCEAMKRAGRQALVAEPEALRRALAEAFAAMQRALAENAAILDRRRSLSEGLVNAVLAEAKRQAGTQLAGYGRTAPRGEKAAAIAFNACA